MGRRLAAQVRGTRTLLFVDVLIARRVG